MGLDGPKETGYASNSDEEKVGGKADLCSIDDGHLLAGTESFESEDPDAAFGGYKVKKIVRTRHNSESGAQVSHCSAKVKELSLCKYSALYSLQ